MRRKGYRRKKIASKWKNASKKKKAVIIVAAVIVLLILLGIISTAVRMVRMRNQMSEMTSTVSAQSATATLGTVENTITGTGNLENDSGTSVTIPSGITVDEVLVESGDTVEEGDVLATVNEASVLSAMETVQANIDAIDESLNDLQDSSTTEAVTTKVDGRVIKIYASADDDVQEVMAENSALMLLSIDGYMAVDLEESTNLEKDDSVIVILSDGTSKTGTVEKVSGSTATILITDSGTDLDDEVTIYDSDGNTLGTGTLYIHEQLSITATGGTVYSISVSEGTSVDSGDTLLKITTDDDSAEYLQLISEREDLTESLQELIELEQTLTITATLSGTISAVNVSDGSSSSSSSSTASASAMSYSSGSTTGSASGSSGSSYTLIALSTSDRGSGSFIKTTSSENTDGDTEDDTNEDTEDNTTESTTEDTTEDTVIQLTVATSGNSTYETLVLNTPVTGNVPQTEITAADSSYTGVISWNPTIASVFDGGVTYIADITLTAADGYCFTSDSITSTPVGVMSGITVSADAKQLSFRVVFPTTVVSTTSTETDDTTDTDDDSTDTTEDNSTDTTGDAGDTDGADGTDTDTEDTDLSGLTGSDSDSTDTGSLTGSSSSGSSVSDTTTSSDSTDSDSSSTDSTLDADGSEYSTNVTAFSISSDENMVISISVDELDINSVSLDQSAEVTMDAIDDTTFEGTVTSVGSSASSSGSGTAKYTVEITIPKTEDMKEGMNASATIVVSQSENVVTIPVDALQESGSEVFVYTEVDDDGNLSGAVTVTTGLSDGSTVEITDGLSEGDTVYYTRTSSSSSDTDSMDIGDIMMGGDDMTGGGGGGGDMGGSGGGGGGMPSGGGGGGGM